MKIFKAIILIVVLGILILFGSSVFKFIQKFEKLGNVRTIEDRTKLSFSSFVAKNIRTSQIDTIKLNGKIIINFWASWCQPCISEQNSLEQLSRSYPDVKCIQLSFDNEADQIRIIDSLSWKLPAYIPQDTLHFAIPEVLPMTLLMKDSIVIKQWFGKKDWQDTSITNLISKL